ncbi:threonine/homoserine efflux transporter RhtA [Maribacter caenipelagi]|uniref:Threonine/homoserine efflux transporter RhtA n=1 Tax=Maribacter caenipelagi TaxID=1447781 RepID=A0A4V6Q005_9FLAO|nr:DMT family transporter [Maribacter caenipelagi]TDS15238.1 threonine/homoserine efflux transporter RhtA [Maribacter caenipelagi]
MKSNHLQHLLEINLAMLFVATSGALGRYVQLPVPVAIGSRAILAFVALFIYCKWKGFSLNVDKKDIPVILLSGVLMGVHWIAYFYALKLSNVAIGMLSIFTYPVITAFLEPILLKTKFQLVHLLLAFLVLTGMYFLSPTLDFENSYTIAIGFGVFSALAYALRNILLKKKVAKYNGSMLMTYQTAIVGVILFPFLFIVSADTIIGQWEVLVALAVLTTAIGHTMFLMTFKHFNITTVSILSSVQPVYGIIIGAIFLSEIPKGTTILGGILILSSVVIESIRSKRPT